MTVRISAKGQLVIPAAIRKRYHLTTGMKLEIVDTGYSIMLVPIPKGDPFLAARGILKGKFSTEEFLKMRREERRRENKALAKLTLRFVRHAR